MNDLGIGGVAGNGCRARGLCGPARPLDMRRGIAVNGFPRVVSTVVYKMSTAAVALLATAALLASGCHDPRISVAQFVRIQQDKSAARATSQPVMEEHGGMTAGGPTPAQLWASKAQVPYRVGPGDVLNVSLLGLNETGTPVVTRARVDKNGTIRLPIAGEVAVADMEIDDVEQAILRKYVPAVVTNLTVHVDMRSYNVTDVVVVGAAVRPGIISLRRTDRDMLHAVAAAGGLTNVASGMVTLQRINDPSQSMRLNLLNPAQLAAALSIKPLEPGDIVTVEAAPLNTIYVGGLVLIPGPKTFAPGSEITLMQALASAGGPREEVAPPEATLIRRQSDGTDVQIRVDLKKLQMGEEPNLQLVAGDILWVPETAGTKVLDFVNRNVFFRFGATASYNVIGNATGVEYLNRRSQQSGQFGGGSGTLQNTIDPLGFLAAPSGN